MYHFPTITSLLLHGTEQMKCSLKISLKPLNIVIPVDTDKIRLQEF